jgi:hypothetical protein
MITLVVPSAVPLTPRVLVLVLADGVDLVSMGSSSPGILSVGRLLAGLVACAGAAGGTTTRLTVVRTVALPPTPAADPPCGRSSVTSFLC